MIRDAAIVLRLAPPFVRRVHLAVLAAALQEVGYPVALPTPLLSHIET